MKFICKWMKQKKIPSNVTQTEKDKESMFLFIDGYCLFKSMITKLKSIGPQKLGKEQWIGGDKSGNRIDSYAGMGWSSRQRDGRGELGRNTEKDS